LKAGAQGAGVWDMAIIPRVEVLAVYPGRDRCADGGRLVLSFAVWHFSIWLINY
jgi:hypothetical protein